MNDLEIGTVVWQMLGKRQNGKIIWHAVPKCIETVEKHRYMFDSGGCSKNCIGKNYFLTRQEALDNHISKYGCLVEGISPNDPLEKMLHPELKDKVTELPRTDWNDLTITKQDSVDFAAVYIGGVDDLRNVTEKLRWRSANAPEHEYYAECLTLREIYEQLKDIYPHAIITVFQHSPLRGTIYQCGNYKDGHWVEHGTTKGYAIVSSEL